MDVGPTWQKVTVGWWARRPCLCRCRSELSTLTFWTIRDELSVRRSDLRGVRISSWARVRQDAIVLIDVEDHQAFEGRQIIKLM